MMPANADHDQTTVYANDAGERLTFAQIAMAAARDPSVTVEEAEDKQGYIFNGELYTPVDRGGRTTG